MPRGPGKYDAQATEVMESTQAAAVVVIVVGGTKGSGFSVQGYDGAIQNLPALLEHLAKGIREAGN